MNRIIRALTGAAFFLCVFAIPAARIHADPGRWEEELSGPGWQLWLDEEAHWKNDSVYLPPVDIAAVPFNPPTCGWDGLDDADSKDVSVPGTVEEYFWGANGNPIGTAGDYRGVSWWSRTFSLDPSLKGKRIILAFDSVNLRAEVFVNGKLAGYDVIGNTPFECTITDAVVFDRENRLDIRITDPVGNFNWNDNDVYRWGKNVVPAVHGFGGVTGKVYLRATDLVHIDDVYVENKPKVNEVEVFVTIVNDTGEKVNGDLFLAIADENNPDEAIWKKAVRLTLREGETVTNMYVKAGKAIPWDIGKPRVYIAATAFRSAGGEIIDSMNRPFGFRWFDIGEKNGDMRLYLNGRRVFLFCAMTRGYWPKNGIFPTPEMAKRETEVMRRLGFNTMLFHRAIGQQYAIEACDREGFLTYEEPGGYRCLPEPDETTALWRREKLRRMVIRDRSCPSLVIYNLKNEAGRPPDDDDIANIRMVHELDPARIVTYNSDRNRDPDVPYTKRLEHDPYKLHMRPFDDELHYYGWWDHHHWFRYPGYVDDCYENPDFYLRGVVNGPSSIAREDSLYRLDKGEIIFWGEEGQWGTMMRLGKVKEELDRTGANGWREKELLSWYDYYDTFLDETGFRKWYPTVDDLTLSLGRNLHYFHGRILENVRMGNVSDGYNLNGWAAPVTTEDIADVYRYPTADPSILAHYARPLYVAVKLRDKVFPAGSSAVADIFIVNEKDLRGAHTLELEFVGPGGDISFAQNYPVSILGGEEFGQLLIEGVELPPMEKAGYYTLNAKVTSGGETWADGSDVAFVIDCETGPGVEGACAVIDTTGAINGFLDDARGMRLKPFDPAGPDLDLIVIGPHDFGNIGQKSYRSRYVNAVMDRVVNGATLIVLDQTDRWATDIMDNLFRHPAVNYRRAVTLGTDGRFFTGRSAYLDGLPQAQGMNWEYQALYRRHVRGLDIGREGTEVIVGLACENRKDILSALSCTPFGNGRVILCTLDIVPWLSSDEPQSAVAKKLFLNLVETPRKRNVWLQER